MTDQYPKTRVPNLIHALLFLAITFLSLLVAEAFILAAAHGPYLEVMQNPRLQLIAEAFSYLIALIAAWYAFPYLWHRTFLEGIAWNRPAARPRLILYGLALGFATQAAESLLPIPKHLPMDDFFKSASLIWFLVILGTLVAPLFEEIFFRGFLLPAIAILIDWIRIPRKGTTLEALGALETWRRGDDYSRPALIASSLITSVLFALLHAPQLGYTWAAVALLACISLVLCYVRIRFQSVAASTLVHAFYNLSVFLTLFIATGGFRHLDRA